MQKIITRKPEEQIKSGVVDYINCWSSNGVLGDKFIGFITTDDERIELVKKSKVKIGNKSLEKALANHKSGDN